MSKKLETLVSKEVMHLGEVVKGELYRGTINGYNTVPDEIICMNDLIVTAGRVFIAKRISAGDTVSSAMGHIAVGTGTTGAALGDTALVAERARKATAINSVLSANVYTDIATFGGFADSVTSAQLTEAGLFNHASSGQ